MKISIITVVRNAETTIEQAIESVRSQDYQDVEHILIDGASSDGTMQIVNRFRDYFQQIVSEPDEGIYDAMNKGVALATGEVIGFLNADDIYQDSTVLTQVAEAHADRQLDACYADLVYVRADDLSNVVRNWKSCDYQPGLCFKGWMPAHPTLFLKRRVYAEAGDFNTQLKYQSDLEYCTRLFEIHKISSRYIPRLWVRMRLGGVTNRSLATMLAGNWESYRALKSLGLERNVVSFFAHKFSSRIRQYF